MKRFLMGTFVITAVAMAACTTARSGGHTRAPAERSTAELMRLYERADYFALRAALDTLPELEGSRAALLRAAVAHAFNDPARSNRELAKLKAGPQELPESLRVEAYRLRFRNHFRLSEYARAAEAARALLRLAAADSAVRMDVENDARVAEALSDAVPQRVVRRAASEIKPRPSGRLPVQIGDSVRAYALDTGANLSAMMRSEAQALGLVIREAGVEVGSSTGLKVTADVAVAPRVRLGGVELANVVFLVLPDEALTFGEFRIPGLIGFPIVDALGEVEFRPDGLLHVPAQVPQREARNLAMRFLTPLVRVEVMGETAVCRLDTGAQHTAMLLPFYERHRARIEEAGRPDTIRTAGGGGERRISAYTLADVRVVVGDAAISLARLPVYAESVAISEDCLLGLDVLHALGGYLLNLRSMSLVVL